MNRFFFLTLSLLAAAASWAVDNGATDEGVGPVERHLQSMESEAWPEPGKAMQGAVKFVFGNKHWHQGNEFTSSNRWLALSCTPSGCTLEAASLSVKQAPLQDNNDDQPTPGQSLVFNIEGAQSRGEVIAWFNTATNLPWLKPGKVTTYYARSFPLKPSNRPGTFEIEIAHPKEGTLLLVPMMASGDSGINNSRDTGTFLLQLRAPGKRQLLLGYLATCSGIIDPQKYLQWSGDLDRDGNPDYLINFIDADGPVHLYLSSQAKPGQLVGLAGVYDSPSSDYECDGG